MPGFKMNLPGPAFAQRRVSTAKAYCPPNLAQAVYGQRLAGKLAGTNVAVNSIRMPAVRVGVARQAGVLAFKNGFTGSKASMPSPRPQ